MPYVPITTGSGRNVATVQITRDGQTEDVQNNNLIDSAQGEILGTTTDAANTTGAAGSIHGLIRGLVTIVANVWNSANVSLNVWVANKLDATNDSVTAILSDGTNATKVNAFGGIAIASASRRNAGILHRNAVTAIDKIAMPGAPTVAAGATSTGSLTAVNTAIALCGGNAWGSTGTNNRSTITPGASQAIRVTLDTTTGNTYNDIFCQLAAGAPAWVCRVPSSQFLTPGLVCTTPGTILTSGAAAAGFIDIGVLGTGQAWNAPNFSSNNAYTPATPTPVSCVGFSRCHILVSLALTDLSIAPALTLIPFLANQVSGTSWHQGAPMVLPLLQNVGQALQQDYDLDIDGSTDIVILVDNIAGNGAAASVWLELA